MNAEDIPDDLAHKADELLAEGSLPDGVVSWLRQQGVPEAPAVDLVNQLARSRPHLIASTLLGAEVSPDEAVERLVELGVEFTQAQTTRTRRLHSCLLLYFEP